MKIVIPSIGLYNFKTKTNSPVRIIAVKDMNGEIIYVRKFSPAVYKFSINFPVGGCYDIMSDNNTDIYIVSTEPLYKPYLPSLPITNFDGNHCSGKIIERAGFDGSPASINLQCGHIVVNEKFLAMPKYAREFILAHEEGHMSHESEDDCDYYALKKIIDNGGNISPCLHALNNVLSRNVNNNIRIKKFIDTINKLT